MFENLVSVLIGAGITWLVARHYYKKAGDELKAEAAHLQRTSEMILRWLETEGKNIKVIRDTGGSPTGLARTVVVTDGITSSGDFIGGELKNVDDETRT